VEYVEALQAFHVYNLIHFLSQCLYIRPLYC